jgi:Fe-S cluster biogenesis protein NfuA
MAGTARNVGERIEQLLGSLRQGREKDTAEELVRLLVEMYGDGLARVVALLRERDPSLVLALTGDELLESLLLLHDLHPVDVDTRIQRALDRVRPYLGSHAGGVRYLGVDERGVARLRLEGSCDGCPSSKVTVSTAIEGAVLDAAPELAGVEVAGVAEPVQLLQIGMGPPGASPAAPPPAAPPPAAPPPAATPETAVKKCEMCGTALAPTHGHVVDVEHRSLMCACRPCFLLFTHGNAAGGRYRAVPERYLHDPNGPLTRAEWEGLGIPVGSAFFLRSEATGLTGFYPSPAGATQCLLDLDAWAELSARHPLLAAAEPDVEAILIRGSRDGSPGGGPADAVECYLVPIDACYQLVGTVRMHWKGFDGGAARERIDEFFDGIRERAQVFGAGG